MCGGREGTQACSNDGQVTTARSMDGAWIWVVLTISLWVLMMVVIYVLRVCSHRHRRHRFLNKFVEPVCRKLGFKVTWADSSQQGRILSSAGMNVFMVASPSPFSDQPPSYEMAVTYVNHAFSPAQFIAPPAYEQITMTSSPEITSASHGEENMTSPSDDDVRVMTSEDIGEAASS